MSVTFGAELHLLGAAEGGRQTPLVSGYRSVVRFGKADSEPAWGVEIMFEAPASLAPGESAAVHVRTFAWNESDPAPPPGTAIFLYEGARLVGTGAVQ